MVRLVHNTAASAGLGASRAASHRPIPVDVERALRMLKTVLNVKHWLHVVIQFNI